MQTLLLFNLLNEIYLILFKNNCHIIYDMRGKFRMIYKFLIQMNSNIRQLLFCNTMQKGGAIRRGFFMV